MGDAFQVPKKPAGYAASASSVSTAGARKNAGDFEFNLGATKNRVLKNLDENVPSIFKKFYNSELFDRMLQAFILYFTAKFQHELLTAAIAKAKKMHMENYNTHAVAVKLHDLEMDMDEHRHDLSPIYSEIILKHSKYNKQQQDKLFWENLYSTLLELLKEAFGRLDKSPDQDNARPTTAPPPSSSSLNNPPAQGSRAALIEQDLGFFFRSRHFNLSRRAYEPQRSVDTLSLEQLYALKHETKNRTMNAKLLSSLYERPRGLAVQAASVSNSPLITQFIQSPIVARSLMKDPEHKRQLVAGLQRSESSATASLAPGAGGLASTMGNRRLVEKSMSVAPRHGGFRAKSAGPSMMSSGVQLPLRVMDTFRVDSLQGRGSFTTASTSALVPVLAPETTGLPMDDNYAYLVLLTKYMTHGPMAVAAALQGPPKAGATLYQGPGSSMVRSSTSQVFPPSSSASLSSEVRGSSCAGVK